MARGEAPREAPVPVPGESVCDSSRVPPDTVEFEIVCAAFDSKKRVTMKHITDNDKILEPRHEKTCFCHMRTAKAQISLRVRACI